MLLVTKVKLKQTPPYHKPSHSFFLNPFLLLFLLSVCDRMITHHCSVELHNLGLDGAMVFSKVTSMLQDRVKVLLVLLPSFALLFHLLLFFKFLCDPEGYRLERVLSLNKPCLQTVVCECVHSHVHTVHNCIYFQFQARHRFVYMY